MRSGDSTSIQFELSVVDESQSEPRTLYHPIGHTRAVWVNYGYGGNT